MDERTSDRIKRARGLIAYLDLDLMTVYEPSRSGGMNVDAPIGHVLESGVLAVRGRRFLVIETNGQRTTDFEAVKAAADATGSKGRNGAIVLAVDEEDVGGRQFAPPKPLRRT